METIKSIFSTFRLGVALAIFLLGVMTATIIGGTDFVETISKSSK